MSDSQTDVTGRAEPGSSPTLDTHKALLVINAQNDAFYHADDFYVTRNLGVVDKMHELIPQFRRLGNIVWICTELPPPTAAAAAALASAKDTPTSTTHPDSGVMQSSATAAAAAAAAARSPYDPSSRAQQQITKAPPGLRDEMRVANAAVFDNGADDTWADHYEKKNKQKGYDFFVAGTRGAGICDQLIHLKQPQDLLLGKRFYSAFDQTSLLSSLRSSGITEVYLCGTMTNVSIYSSAADAVQHGLSVTVIEDCLGWRSAGKHAEALRQMADIMGVQQTTSEEIIREAERECDSLGRGGSLSEGGLGVEQLSLDESENDGRSLRQEFGTRSASESGADSASDLKGVFIQADGRGSAMASSQVRDHEPQDESIIAPHESFGSGDSTVIPNLLDTRQADQLVRSVKAEVTWQKMSHRGGEVPRLVAVQGDTDSSGAVPLYRHPVDEAPPLLQFTPAVHAIRECLQERLQQQFNHVLIQLYRSGEDNISEHADKTLDIVHGSNIANVSLGARRVMTLRRKKQRRTTGQSPCTPEDAAAAAATSPGYRQSQRVLLPHNSVFVLGPRTNREWLHGVRADKRPDAEKDDEDRAFSGERISLTFRHIGTFLNEDARTVWGSGAKSKTATKPGRIADDDVAQMERLILAFARENHEADFDWDAEYGAGFDVVHLALSPPKCELLLCADPVANLRVQLALTESGIEYGAASTAIGPGMIPTPPPNGSSDKKFSSVFEKPWIHGLVNLEVPMLSGLTSRTDPIQGDMAILVHLERYLQRSMRSALPPASGKTHPQYTSAQLYSCFAEANELLYLWYEYRQLHASSPASMSRAATSRYAHENPTSPTVAATMSANIATIAATTNPSSAPMTTRFALENNSLVSPAQALRKELEDSLRTWEEHLEQSHFVYITSDQWNVIDCAVWPVLHSMASSSIVAGGSTAAGEQGRAQQPAFISPKTTPQLARYYRLGLERESVHAILEREAGAVAS